MLIGAALESRVTMFLSLSKHGAVDRLAIGLSGLCLVHCIGTSVLVLFLSTAGGLLDPHIHEIGLVLAIILGVIGLGSGIRTHGFMLPAAIGALGLGTMAGSLTLHHGPEEVIYSIFGVSLLALGHTLNRRAVV